MITTGGDELADGSTNVPTTLDLRISAGRGISGDEVKIALDNSALPIVSNKGAVTASSAAQSLGSTHHLAISVDGVTTKYSITIVPPTSAMAAVHTDGNNTDLDLDFSAAPNQSAVIKQAPGISFTWLDPTRARAKLSKSTTSHLHLPSSIATAGGSHLASNLDVDLSAPQAGTLRRVEVPAAPVSNPELLAFTVGTAASHQSLGSHLGQIKVVSPTGWRIGPGGASIAGPDPAAVSLAQSQGLSVWPLVQNAANDRAAAAALLNTDAANNFATQAVSMATANGFGGVQLDIEGIPPTSESAFTGFATTIAKRLHASGVKLVVDVIPHKPGHLTITSAAYDLPALAKVADYLVFLAYDQHTAGTGSGPVAGYSWVQQLLAGSLSGLPKSKIWLGVPLYARSWQDQSAAADSYSSALATALSAPGAVVSEDFVERAPYVNFQSPGQSATVTYFDDAISLQWKDSLAKQNGLAGIAAWRLGFEDPGWWKTL